MRNRTKKIPTLGLFLLWLLSPFSRCKIEQKKSCARFAPPAVPIFLVFWQLQSLSSSVAPISLIHLLQSLISCNYNHGWAWGLHHLRLWIWLPTMTMTPTYIIAAVFIFNRFWFFFFKQRRRPSSPPPSASTFVVATSSTSEENAIKTKLN